MIDIQLKDSPIFPKDCIDFVADDGTGGSTVSYAPMAISEMRKIAERAKERWSCTKVSIHHRVGVLAIGEIAVIIAVATEFCIDTLKETVPIWKREFFEDGDVWVAAHP